MEEAGFDVAPVRERPISRFIDRRELPDNPTMRVRDVAKPIFASDLVTAGLGLAQGVEHLRNREFYFVLDRNALYGIVTRADLQRPAVSMVTLSLILAAEAGLDRLYERFLGPDWIERLSLERRQRAERVLQVRRKHNTDISLVQCLMLEDRLTLVRKAPALRSWVQLPAGRAFVRWEAELKRLRDDLAHGGNLLTANSDPVAAVELFTRVHLFARRVWKDAPQDKPRRSTLPGSARRT